MQLGRYLPPSARRSPAAPRSQFARLAQGRAGRYVVLVTAPTGLVEHAVVNTKRDAGRYAALLRLVPGVEIEIGRLH
jgi:hypothetical protein